MMEAVMLANNPHIKYLNDRDHGYLLLTLKPDKAIAKYYVMETLRKPDKRERLEKTLEVEKGKTRLNQR
jgi:phosphodiesterase/alkaline phosphatase D-like protein